MTSGGLPSVPEQGERVDALLPFVHSLSSLLPEIGVDPLTAKDVAEVNRRCDEMRAARARAEVSGRDYIIWR